MAHYLITGGGGFIGSNLARALVEEGETVQVLDDFSTGRRENLEGLKRNITIIEGTICDREAVRTAIKGVNYCLHQAAIPSVPRSIAAPEASNRANIEGTLNVLLAAREAGVRRVVLASSSSVYGNVAGDPLVETLPRRPISPYGVTKACAEMYGEVFASLYDLDIVSLRYFNVFGPRQNPDSQYAAAIPIFVRHMLAGRRPPVHGDGRQARDFTFVSNVVSANLLVCRQAGSLRGVFNVACGAAANLLEVIAALNRILGADLEPEFQPRRAGDIPWSCADISQARQAFGYVPKIGLEEGLRRTVSWLRDGKDPA